MTTIRMIGWCEKLLAPDLLRLLQLKLSLNKKLDVLKQLDSEILEMIEEDKVANEIEQSDQFKEGIYTIDQLRVSENILITRAVTLVSQQKMYGKWCNSTL